jgi:hypothetical protein
MRGRRLAGAGRTCSWPMRALIVRAGQTTCEAALGGGEVTEAEASDQGYPSPEAFQRSSSFDKHSHLRFQVPCGPDTSDRQGIRARDRSQEETADDRIT